MFYYSYLQVYIDTNTHKNFFGRSHCVWFLEYLACRIEAAVITIPTCSVLE